MKRIEIDEIRKIQLSIMDRIDAFCKEKGLRYSLAGGSLIGAVRHKGYIPWDDDIDIVMPRPDYEVFIKDFRCLYPDLTVQTVQSDETYNRLFAKVYDNRTEIIEPLLRTGVYVDIFIVDGISSPEEMENRCKEYAYEQYLLGKVTKFFEFQQHKWFLRIKYYVKRLLYPSRAKLIERYERLWKQYPFETSKYAGVLNTVYGTKECMETDVFCHYSRDLLFEGRHYMHVTRYHDYLTNLYGDYMTPPPPEQRVSHHEPNVFWKDEAGS